MRVAGQELPAPVDALSYMDLRYDDGRVERWFGPGERRELADDVPIDGEGLVGWGTDVIETMAGCLLEELATSYANVKPSLVLAAPIEIVVRWNETFQTGSPA